MGKRGAERSAGDSVRLGGGWGYPRSLLAFRTVGGVDWWSSLFLLPAVHVDDLTMPAATGPIPFLPPAAGRQNAHPRRKTSRDDGVDEIPDCGNQQQEPENIGYEPGGDEESTCYQNCATMAEFPPRQPALTESLLEATENRQPGATHQQRADESRGEGKSQRPAQPDSRLDPEERRHLEEGNHGEHSEKSHVLNGTAVSRQRVPSPIGIL